MRLPDWVRRWLREPLVHFLVAGALLFAWFSWQGSPVDPASRSIAFDGEQVAAIAMGHEQQTGRAPTDQELDTLIEAAVREEVLYREALRLGLDQDDPVVRRRMSQKMDLIAGASAQLAQPTQAELQAWMKTHPARFSTDPRYTFDQIFFTERPQADLALQSGDLAAKLEIATNNRDIPARVSAMTQQEVAARFGRQFLGELRQLEPQAAWKGPVPSGLGWHIVRLTEITPGTAPDLEDIRDAVEADWRQSTAADRKEQAYHLLRDAYSIEIER